MNKITILKGLKAEHFIHPGDKIFIEELNKHETFKKLMERLLIEGLEEDMYLMSLADNVKLGSKNGKKIYDMLIEASRILDMPVPELFMDTNPMPNSFAFGEKKPLITLTSGLIDTFPDDEIFTVIGHELGHIKCRHTLYSLLARNIFLLMQLFSLIPFMGAAIGIGLYIVLLAWYRRAELSADRAALLATQSKELVTRTMMRLAGGGSTKISEFLSEEAFLEQAAEYEKLQAEIIASGGLKTLSHIFGTFWTAALNTHPWPALRTKELIRFNEGERYKSIIALKYPVTDEKTEGFAFASEGISTEFDLKGHAQDLGKDLKDKTVSFSKNAVNLLKTKLEQAAKYIEKEEKKNKDEEKGEDGSIRNAHNNR